MDLLDVFRDRISARKVLALIDHLPRDSAYVDALAADEDAAEAFTDSAQDGGKPAAPPMRQWSMEVELLAAVVDRLGDVIAGQIVAAGHRPPKIKPVPRPVTAADRVQQRRKRERHEQLVARVLPHKNS